MNPPADIEEQRALAQAMFPAQWAATLPLPGERRRRRQANLRAQAVAERTMAPLREAGACCANCAGHGRFPHDSQKPPRMTCDDESDFHGYAIVEPGDLCPSWRPMKTQGRAQEPRP